MIELLVLFFLNRHLADTAMDRGRYSVWGWLGVALWLVGEAIGAVVAVALGLHPVVAYGVMLLTAAIGATIAYSIVHNLEIRGPAVARVPARRPPVATFAPCRECAKMIAKGLDRCPYCLIGEPSNQEFAADMRRRPLSRQRDERSVSATGRSWQAG